MSSGTVVSCAGGVGNRINIERLDQTHSGQFPWARLRRQLLKSSKDSENATVKHSGTTTLKPIVEATR